MKQRNGCYPKTIDSVCDENGNLLINAHINYKNDL